MLENTVSSQQETLKENEKREIQLSVALSTFVTFRDIDCKNDDNDDSDGGYKYKEKTVSEILKAEQENLKILQSGAKIQKNDFTEKTKSISKKIAHTGFIVDNLKLGNLILMDSSLMHKNDEEFKKLGMNDGIRIYIFKDEKTKSLYVVSRGTIAGEFSVLPDMIFASEKSTMTTNLEKEKNDLMKIYNSNANEKITIENKNEDELNKSAISKQNIIFNSVASKLLEPYMDEKGNFNNEWQNIYFIGHSSGGNKVMDLFASKILNSQDPNKELKRCKCICINSIGWADETKSYFEKGLQEKGVDFTKFTNQVTDVKGSKDPISVINNNPIGKTVRMKSKGHLARDFNLNQFVDSPDRKYYMYTQFFAYIKNYLSGIQDPAERDEKITTILEAFDYHKNQKERNVYGEDITTYRTKVLIIVLWVLFKSYVKALIVVYVFRIEPIIDNHQNEFMTNFSNEEQGNFIDNINEKEKTEGQKRPLSDLDESQPNLNFT